MPDNVDIASNREEFRAWLAQNHASERECWLRVRADNIQRVKSRPEEFDKRLNHLIEQTKSGRMYGDWDDFGRLSPGAQ